MGRHTWNSDGVLDPSFDFVALPRRKPVKKKTHFVKLERGQHARSTYYTPHLDERHGPEWPRKAGWRKYWTGWMTHREYNLIECYIRFEMFDLYEIGKFMKLKPSSTQRMYYAMLNAGVLTGDIDNVRITDMAKILFDMTDQYILELDLGDA